MVKLVDYFKASYQAHNFIKDTLVNFKANNFENSKVDN